MLLRTRYRFVLLLLLLVLFSATATAALTGGRSEREEEDDHDPGGSNDGPSQTTTAPDERRAASSSSSEPRDDTSSLATDPIIPAAETQHQQQQQQQQDEEEQQLIKQGQVSDDDDDRSSSLLLFSPSDARRMYWKRAFAEIRNLAINFTSTAVGSGTTSAAAGTTTATTTTTKQGTTNASSSSSSSYLSQWKQWFLMDEAAAAAAAEEGEGEAVGDKSAAAAAAEGAVVIVGEEEEDTTLGLPWQLRRFEGFASWERKLQEWADDVQEYLNTTGGEYRMSTYGYSSSSSSSSASSSQEEQEEEKGGIVPPLVVDDKDNDDDDDVDGNGNDYNDDGAAADTGTSEDEEEEEKTESSSSDVVTGLSSRKSGGTITAAAAAAVNVELVTKKRRADSVSLPRPEPARPGEHVLPHTDLADKSKKVWIVTTASLPWRTGTAVNPLLRAAYMTAGRADAGGSVTLMLPWLERAADQVKVYGVNSTFASPDEQESYLRTWLREAAQLPAASRDLKIAWYTAWQNPAENSIYSMGDITALIPADQVDICILEEPEHLNWYRAPGESWTTKFPHVVGILHTNYFQYALDQPAALIRAPAMRLLCSWMCRAHCHRVIKLSGTLDRVAPEKEIVENVHGVRGTFLDVGERLRDKLLLKMGDNTIVNGHDDDFVFGPSAGIGVGGGSDSDSDSSTVEVGIQHDANNNGKEEPLPSLSSMSSPSQQTTNNETTAAAAASASTTTAVVYFIGKMLWSKGLSSLMELLKYAEESADLKVAVDMYGGGPDMDAAESKAVKMKLPMSFHGPVDHAELAWSHKIFVNPSTSEVLCTTSAEALAMGKFAILPSHPSNDFFAQFPNCLTYATKEEFVGNLYYALTHPPEPLSWEYARALSWEAATERLEAAGCVTVREAERMAEAIASNDAGIEIELPPLVESEESRQLLAATFRYSRERYRQFRTRLSNEIRQSKVLPKSLRERFLGELDSRLDLDIEEILASPKLRLRLSPAELDKSLLELYNTVTKGPGGDVLRVLGGGNAVAMQDLYIKKQAMKERRRDPEWWRRQRRQWDSIGVSFPSLVQDSYDGTDRGAKGGRSATQSVRWALRRNLLQPVKNVDDVDDDADPDSLLTSSSSSSFKRQPETGTAATTNTAAETSRGPPGRRPPGMFAEPPSASRGGFGRPGAWVGGRRGPLKRPPGRGSLRLSLLI